MNYELAKELKDAGFPWWDEDEELSICKCGCGKSYNVPNLSGLIEACGDDFRWLKRRGHQWMAQGRPHPVGEKEPKAWGATPDEAVARLWLALK